MTIFFLNKLLIKHDYKFNNSTDFGEFLLHRDKTVELEK